MIPRTRSACILLVGLALLFGCGGGAHDTTDGALPPAAEEILLDVAAIRQLELPEGLEAFVITRRELPDVLDSLLTPEDLQDFKRLTHLYRALGYLGPEQDYLDIYQEFTSVTVVGFYSVERKALWVVADRSDASLETLTVPQHSTLVHEFVHALQDYHFDLEAAFESVRGDPDRELALLAVVEGDAVHHQRSYAMDYAALPVASGILALTTSAQLPGVPPAIARELRFPYTTGATFATRVIDRSGLQGLNEVLRQPPVATALILNPDRLASGWEPLSVDFPAHYPAVSPGWDLVATGSLGEFHLANYLEASMPPGAAAHAAASSYG